MRRARDRCFRRATRRRRCSRAPGRRPGSSTRTALREVTSDFSQAIQGCRGPRPPIACTEADAAGALTGRRPGIAPAATPRRIGALRPLLLEREDSPWPNPEVYHKRPTAMISAAASSPALRDRLNSSTTAGDEIDSVVSSQREGRRRDRHLLARHRPLIVRTMTALRSAWLATSPSTWRIVPIRTPRRWPKRLCTRLLRERARRYRNVGTGVGGSLARRRYAAYEPT